MKVFWGRMAAMARRRFGRTMAMGLGLGLAACLVASADSPPKSQLLWEHSRAFRIPVTVPEESRKQIREMILWSSDDAGYAWKKATQTTPDAPEFAFRAPRDGEYWFAVQTLDTNGKFYPNGDTPPEPMLRVIVDSVRPTVVLEPQGRRGTVAGVRWEVEDDHLLLSSLALEYQSEGARDWRQVPLAPGDLALIGAKSWDTGTGDTVKVRLTVRDRAGNSRSAEQVLADGLADNPDLADAESRRSAPPVKPISGRPGPTFSTDDADGFGPMEPPPTPPGRTTPRVADENGFEVPETAPGPAPDRDFASAPRNSFANRSPRGSTAGETLMVGSQRFPLKYEVEDAGPGGPALVELWMTRDSGRSWTRQPKDADCMSPYNVDLGGDGLFGLCLVVQSASGLGDLPPAPRDQPQMWVEVDSQPPSVILEPPRSGRGTNMGKVEIRWRASDAHLADRPVMIYYREDRPDSPWVPIGERMDNLARYIWTVPESIPPRFHLKVEAQDTLGNKGSDDTLNLGPVLLDRARPRGRILGLEPGSTSRQ